MRPLFSQGVQAYAGAAVATVVNNRDPDGLGRVRVHFPWLATDDAREASYWARLAVPMVGANFGTWYLPEIHDQVVVMFQQGDFRFPFVVGGLWGKEDLPPWDNASQKNNFRLIKSRSGHRLIFDDTDGSTPKVVVTDKDHRNYLDVGSFDKTSDDSPNAVEISKCEPINGSPSKGVAVISKDGKINLFAPSGTIKVSGMNVELTCRGKTEISASSALKASGLVMGKVVAGGPAKFQGATVGVGMA
jgi:uncharacterized protein involved in type VI secretion and phage assembly